MPKEAVTKKPIGFSCRTIELGNLNTTEAALVHVCVDMKPV